MKSGKKALFLLFSGIFMLLVCVIMPDTLAQKCKLLNGQLGMHKAVVSAKLNSSGDKAKLTPGALQKLARSLKIKDYCYEACSDTLETSLTANGKHFTAGIIGTNYMLPEFRTLTALQGGFFTKNSEKEGGYIAVIDDKLAWSVFMTSNVIGKTLELYCKTFKIVGVVKGDHSILSSLKGDTIPYIYIPGEKMLELDKKASVNNFQLRTLDTSTLDRNKGLVSDAISKIGYISSDFSITDCNISQALLDQKTEIIIFIMGCIIIFLLLIWLWHILKNMASEIRRQCRTDYLTNVIRQNFSNISFNMLKVIFAASAIYLVLVNITFKLYIPPEYLPEELIDVSFYSKLVVAGIARRIGNPDHMTDAIGLLMDEIGLLTGGILVLAALAGLLLVLGGAGALRPESVKLNKAVLWCGLFTLLSLALLAAAAIASGLPFILEPRNIMVVWAFIYINVWFKYYQFERMS
jgi:hypothetical protein